jgi:broad specificity phosphatase PhoE
MILLLIRHLESEKNIANTFSSSDDFEPLTRSGQAEGMNLANDLARFISYRKLRVGAVYSANSQRARTTAEFIAHRIGVPVLPFDGLVSIGSGQLSGMREEQVEEIEPDLVWKLHLYRAGVYNSYDIRLGSGAESIPDFERRVQKTVSAILAIPDEDLKVIVTHRSPLTATLLHFARSFLNYPNNFYGYIQLDCGKLSFVEKTDDGRWLIRRVNCNAIDLLTP